MPRQEDWQIIPFYSFTGFDERTNFRGPGALKFGQLECGVLQGGPVSPLLFTLANHPATHKMSWMIEHSPAAIPPLIHNTDIGSDQSLTAYADDERATVCDKQSAALAAVSAQICHERTGGKLGFRNPRNGIGSKTAIFATGRARESFGLTDAEIKAGAVALTVEDQLQALETLDGMGLNSSNAIPVPTNIPMVTSYNYLGTLLCTKEVTIRAGDHAETLWMLDMMPHINKRCAMAEQSIGSISNAAVNSDWSLTQFSTILYQAVAGTALDGIHATAAAIDPPEVHRGQDSSTTANQCTGTLKAGDNRRKPRYNTRAVRRIDRTLDMARHALITGVGRGRPTFMGKTCLPATMMRTCIWTPSATARIDLATYRCALHRLTSDSIPNIRVAMWHLLMSGNPNPRNGKRGPLRNMASVLLQEHNSADSLATLQTNTKDEMEILTTNYKQALRVRELDRVSGNLDKKSSHAK